MRDFIRARKTRLCHACFAATALAAACAQASTLYWDTDGSTAGNTTSGANLGGSGTWSAAAPANWWDPALPALQSWTDGNDAVFSGTAGTATVSNVAAASLTFKSTGYTIAASTLTMTPSPANFTVDSGVTATISSALAGTGTMTKLGAGTLVLTNSANINTASTSAGGWRIDGGTLRLAGDGSLGAPLPDTARNTITDIQINQSTIQFAAPTEININRRTKVNTNSSTNLGDAIIDVNEFTVSWFGSIQGGAGTLRVTCGTNNGGMLILGTDKIASINPFGSVLPAGTVNLTVENHVVVQTSGQVTPTGGELGSETGAGGAPLAILLQTGGQIRAESGGYEFQRNLILGPGGGSLDSGAWAQTFLGTISGSGALAKFGTGTLVLDNPSATWAGGTNIHSGTVQLGRGGSNGLLPGTLVAPSSVVIDSGATLKFLRGSNKSFFDVISGAGSVVVANSPTATVRLVSDNTYTGPTTITSGTLMIGQGNPGEPGSIVSNVINNANLVFNKVESQTYAGIISGTGAVTKQGAGILTLPGTHTYTGATSVAKGKLNVTGALANTAVTVSPGASLGGTGSIAGQITVIGGATSGTRGTIDLLDGMIGLLKLTDGNSADTVLTLGDTAAGASSALNFEVGATADLISILTGKLAVNPGGGIITITPASGFTYGTYDLIQFPIGQASGLSNLSLAASTLPGGYTLALQSTPTAEQVVVTPEPGTLLLIALTMFPRRRRARSRPTPVAASPPAGFQ